jgi:hypothetical protein
MSEMDADGSKFMEVNKTYLGTKPKENARAGRLAWLGHLPDTQKVAGSSPARPTHFPSEKNLIGAHSPQKRGQDFDSNTHIVTSSFLHRVPCSHAR